jgi:hypothetical protein
MVQAIQLIGAFLILIAYALAQLGALAPRGAPFLLLNLTGALVLTGGAWHEEQWGFLVLEAAWALVSAVGLLPRPSEPATTWALRLRPASALPLLEPCSPSTG